MNMDSVNREIALRAHVHRLLDEYVITHLTTDYVDFTQYTVNELLSASLDLIPTSDPTSLVLEPTLTEQVSTAFKLTELPNFQERLTVDSDSIAYLQNAMRSILSTPKIPHGRTRSERSWMEDTDHCQPLYPMSPILTLRALRQTPKLRKLAAEELIPGPLPFLLKENGLDEVDTTLAEAELARVDGKSHNINEMLGHKISIDPDTRSSVLDCIRSARLSEASRATGNNSHVTSFLRNESPTYEVPQLASPPLFSRDRNPGGLLLPLDSTSAGPGLSGMRELGALVHTKQDEEEEEEDLYKQHMLLVNGWETYHIPSSPTPSLQSPSKSNDEVDELDIDQYMPWSSDTGHEYQRGFLFEKMEEYEIPRSERIGGSTGSRRIVGEHQSLQSFLSFLEPVPKTPQKVEGQDSQRELRTPITIPTKPSRSPPSSPTTTITASLLGQPPTGLGADSDTRASAESDDVSSDDIGINRVLKTMGRHNVFNTNEAPFNVDPQDFILKETLDDRESYLMDVPDLPPPNEHPPNGMQVPTSLPELLVQKNHQVEPLIGEADGEARGFLQQVKGLKSLNIELNWRPFNFGSHIPTNEEVARLLENVQVECLENLRQEPTDHDDRDDEHLSRLLNDFSMSDTCNDPAHEAPSEQIWKTDDSSPSRTTAGSDGDEEFILTVGELKRVYGLPTLPPGGEMSEDTDDADDIADERPVKRLRFSSPVIIPFTAASFENEEPDICSPRSSLQALDVDDILANVDDSGVFLPEHETSFPRPSVFGQLASGAQGFDGTYDDGEVTPDVDRYLEDVERYDPSRPIRTHPETHDLDFAPGAAMDFDEMNSGYDLAVSAPPGHELDSTEGGLSIAPVPFTDEEQHAPMLTDDLPAQHPLEQPVMPRTSPPQGPSAKQSLHEFMKMRSKTIPQSDTVSHSPISRAATEAAPPVQPIEIPPELVDSQTLDLSQARSWTATMHRYLCSVDFIQKRGLVRALASPQCAVELIEREHLGGVDIILDPDTAILFAPLRALPVRCDDLTDLISKLSWRFLNLLVVFDSFPAGSHSHADAPDELLTVNPFSPPVVKAVKKLRRNVLLAEGCYDKRTDTAVRFAFPLTLQDAARAVRLYGDRAQQADVTGGALWDDRRWLDLDDEDADERDLAAIDGMNVFAAAVILCSISLDDFLDKTPEERVEEFGDLIGRSRVATFNAVIARRKEALELPSSSPPSTSIQTSKSTTPMDVIMVEPYS